jgi:hypothetical protein
MAMKINDEFTKANNALAETKSPPLPENRIVLNTKYPIKYIYGRGMLILGRIEHKNAHGNISELNRARAGVIFGRNTKYAKSCRILSKNDIPVNQIYP